MREQVQRPGYRPANDPQIRKGIATITQQAVGFNFGQPVSGGLCLLQAMVAQEVMRHCRIEAHIEFGSMLYRVGPDPIRDVIAFCGPGNAGVNLGDALGLYHAWLTVDDHIADFSVGDWPSLSTDEALWAMERGLPDLGPVQWTIPKPPQYWWRPRSELTGAWRSTRTPALGQVWYGPFNGDPMVAHRRIRDFQIEAGPQIADAVFKVMTKSNAEHGYDLGIAVTKVSASGTSSVGRPARRQISCNVVR
jgi:hypothetical protein